MCTCTCITSWAGSAPEPRYSIVAGRCYVARVGQVTLVQVGAGGAVAGQPLGAGTTPAVNKC